MEQLTLKPRQPVEEAIENWDDDDLDIGGSDLTFRSASLATTATHAPSHHRDSFSSRLSFRSEYDSIGDEERHVHLPEDDDRATIDAISAATKAGIPIPNDVPSSALLGGTIKRLGGRKVQRIIQDDWDDDLEMPKPGEGFKLKTQDSTSFPETLRQISGSYSPEISPRSLQPGPVFNLAKRVAKPISNIPSLEKFRDNDDDDDFFGAGQATIKVPKSRSAPKPSSMVTPPTPRKINQVDDDFEQDFQIPADGKPLQLSARNDIPKTPNNAQDDFEEWGSLGTRFGGTRRGQSNRSSSISALSPSVSSSITFESEDEGLDGLILPVGPLHFDDLLKKRKQNHSPVRFPDEKPETPSTAPKDDFLSGLDIGDGDVFESSKFTLNRNVKIKTARTMSPQRPKTAVSLTFTNKPASVSSRLPRPQSTPSSLPPVSESGGPIITRSRRSQSRVTGTHSAHSSISTIPTPATPSSHSQPPSTPRRRDLATKSSLGNISNGPTTTNAQLLKMKRSMPAMRAGQSSPVRPMSSRFERPSSRTDNNRHSLSRPKTPVEKERAGSEPNVSQHLKKNPVPFLPAGASHAQSHHVAIKTSRHFRRNDSESSNELRPSSRAFSRSTMRSPSPSRPRSHRGAESLAREAASRRQITKPVRRQHFGNGGELDGFDDLPTSSNIEARFTKQPVGRGAPKLMRNKHSQTSLPENKFTPAPPTPVLPVRPVTADRNDNLPRFAQDTNASRRARETNLSQRVVSSGAPLTTLTNNWKTQVSARTGLSGPVLHPARGKKRRNQPQQKPHLIKPLGNTSSNPKSIKGMTYNPQTYCWEGNEKDLSYFDMPVSSPLITTDPSAYKETIPTPTSATTPRPALITNINASQGVQVVGGMVFDPQRMCWLKMAPQSSENGRSEAGDTMDGFDALDDEDDVFAGVPDLDDSPAKEHGKGRKSEIGGGKDDWLVGEEFDVGPEFVRRQREEEERWRRKCEKWLGVEREKVEETEGEGWRWSIRDVVAS